MATHKGSSTPYSTPPAPYSGPGSTSATAKPGSPATPPKGGWQGLVSRLGKQAGETLKGQFVVLALGIMVLAIVMAFVISQSFSRTNDDLNTINSGSRPSVDAAQQLAQYIEDIDAKSADYLATAGLNELKPCSVAGSTVDPGQQTVHNCDDLTINSEIILANKKLFDAARNVTYPGEQTAIERITAGFEEYVADITVMRREYALAVGKTDPHDVHLQNAYEAYKKASDVLHTSITQKPILDANNHPVFNEPNPVFNEPSTFVVPSCSIDSVTEQYTYQPNEWVQGSLEKNIDCLNSINKQALKQAYSDTQGFLNGTVWLALVMCLVFCALLAFATLRMMTTTHRVMNIGLTLALLVGVIYSFVIVGQFMGMTGQPNSHDASQHGAFKQIVEDDYGSIYAAAQLNRYGTAANADESRWLIALEFNDQPNVDHWATDWQQNTQRVHVLMQAAHANRTWTQEDQPLADMQSNWESYFSIDGQIRSAANANHLPDAERISTGPSNDTFGKFSDAVVALSKANDLHYQGSLAWAQGVAMMEIILSAILFPLIGLAAVWGVSLRLKDF